jgi:diaminopimelate epimerase
MKIRILKSEIPGPDRFFMFRLQNIPFTEKGSGIVPRGRPFIKMHGLRNDFIVVDGRTQPYRPSVEEIVRICDRREGVGGDELLIIDPPRAGSADAAAFVRIFNPVGMNIGNPHAVFFVDDLASVDLTIWGPQLQKHPLFPQEANIGAAQLIDAKTLKLSVWERPGALTTACGTGACVAVAAAHRRGLTEAKRMTVIMPAGSVEIKLQGDDSVVMTGPVETCFTGYLPVS